MDSNIIDGTRFETGDWPSQLLKMGRTIEGVLPPQRYGHLQRRRAILAAHRVRPGEVLPRTRHHFRINVFQPDLEAIHGMHPAQASDSTTDFQHCFAKAAATQVDDAPPQFQQTSPACSAAIVKRGICAISPGVWLLRTHKASGAVCRRCPATCCHPPPPADRIRMYAWAGWLSVYGFACTHGPAESTKIDMEVRAAACRNGRLLLTTVQSISDRQTSANVRRCCPYREVLVVVAAARDVGDALARHDDVGVQQPGAVRLCKHCIQQRNFLHLRKALSFVIELTLMWFENRCTSRVPPVRVSAVFRNATPSTCEK